MASGCMLRSIAAGALSLAAFGQKTMGTAPLTGDTLELVTGQIRAVRTAESRTAATRLLDRARNNYALRSAGPGYDLKIGFTVDSGGQTEHDGAWTMEDVFDPKQGLRWTAQAEDSYSITRISANGMRYGEDTASYVPLRLQEVRAALFDPLPSSEWVAHASIRKSTATFNGAPVTCILLSGSKNTGNARGRRWDETEDCIDPQSGLLQTHSQVPGHYYSYEYTGAQQIDGHVLPRKVTVTEAGKTVTVISLDSQTDLPAADPGLFVPTDEMKARGRAIEMAGAEKIWHDFGRGPLAPGAMAHIVCVFGVVTPSGQLVEAHSLQPSDPYSSAAVEAAKHMSFSRPPLGNQPQQHFVFVVERFVSSR